MKNVNTDARRKKGVSEGFQRRVNPNSNRMGWIQGQPGTVFEGKEDPQ